MSACELNESGIGISEICPKDNTSLRSAVYRGTIVKLPANAASLQLISAVEEMVTAVFGSDYRRAQFRLCEQEFFQDMAELKKSVYASPYIRDLTVATVAACGFDLNGNLFDPPRVRAVLHDGHLNPAARPAYSLHRDTWYANPQAQINWWIPMHDVGSAETFSFFSGYFNHRVRNSSDQFDYDTWSKQVGFGNSHSGRGDLYPSVLAEVAKESPLHFSAMSGQILVFSAAHLHGTNANSSGLSRFSIDFRTVHCEDHATGAGAPNVDNASTGSAVHGYQPCLSVPGPKPTILREPGVSLQIGVRESSGG